jgi:hypothetical protein
MALPDDEELLNELVTVRLRESSPGVYRLDHDSGQHDDSGVPPELAALALTEKPDTGYASVSSVVGISGAGMRAGAVAELGARAAQSNPYAAWVRGEGAAIIAATQRAQTPLQRLHGNGLAVPGSANGPTAR